MIVAAHQPHFLPWLGYLAKLASCDLFVVMDDLQYESQNFQNRNRVKVNNGTAWLTVPLARGPQNERIRDKQIDASKNGKEDWQRRSWETLKVHYGACPYFDHYAGDLEQVFTRRWKKLLDLNLHMLELHRAWFGLCTPVLLASSLALRGVRTGRILDLCRAVGIDSYLSGSGASTAYLDTQLLARHGVRVAWQVFHHPEYPQRYPQQGFVPRLCALDLLLNCGPSSREILQSGIERWPEVNHEKAV
jgi:WbqC-like protein